MTSQLNGKRILVTGATGFIGGYVARRLLTEGAEVVALARSPEKGVPLQLLGIEVAQGDITDQKRMAQILASDIQIVMHIAAWLRGYPLQHFETTNVSATRSLAQISARTGVERFVFTSSIAVYGLHGDHDVDETTPLKLYGDPYGDSKIKAEWALGDVAKATGLPCIIVRPGMVYGPGSPGWTVRLARWAMRGRLPVIDGGRGTAYPVYIDNLVDLLVLCAARPDAPGHVFNGVDDGPVTLAEFLGGYMRMIPTSRAIRLPGWVIKAGAFVLNPIVPVWNLNYVANQLAGRGMVRNNRAKEFLGWEPHIGLQEGLALSERWLREKGIIPART